jgi:hypothetical protein
VRFRRLLPALSIVTEIALKGDISFVPVHVVWARFEAFCSPSIGILQPVKRAARRASDLAGACHLGCEHDQVRELCWAWTAAAAVRYAAVSAFRGSPLWCWCR